MKKHDSTVSGASEKVKDEGKGTGGVGAKMSGMGEKARTVISGVGDKVSGTDENALKRRKYDGQCQ